MIYTEDDDSIEKADIAFVVERTTQEILIKIMRKCVFGKGDMSVLLELAEELASELQDEKAVKRVRSLLIKHPDWDDERVVINAFPLPVFSFFAGNKGVDNS